MRPECFSLASVSWEESEIHYWEKEGDAEKVDTGSRWSFLGSAFLVNWENEYSVPWYRVN